MAWRDDLLPASFRGVPFRVEGHATGGGRRGELLEYPQRDLPHFDDVGRKARTFKIAGYVIGPDYRFDAALLREALEAATPGLLSHPSRGLQTVVCLSFEESETSSDGLMATFSVEFAEAGLPAFPAFADSVLSAIALATDAVEMAAAFDFAEVLEVIGKPGAVLIKAISDTARTVGKVTDAIYAPGALIGSQVGDIASGLQRLADNTSALLQAPEGVVAQWEAIFALVTSRETAQAAAANLALATVVSGSATPTVQTQQSNEVAIFALPRRLAIARACSLVATEDIPIYEDARAVRDALLGLIDVEISTLPLIDDAVIQALQDLRVQTARAIDANAGDAVRLRTHTPVSVLPACVLAQQLYGDGSRGDEIVDRNGIGHPGFVPARPLRVLAS